MIILAILCPILAFFAFYAGFRTAKQIYVKQDFCLPKPQKIHSSETEQERISRIVAENIDAYGTNTPQKDVN